MDIKERQRAIMEKGAASITQWVGSTTSVILHTILFIISFVLPLLGVVTFERMLLVLTTIVSLEAIYLSIFIQMSINMNNQNIEIIQEDIEEMSEDIEELGEDIEEISEDIEEMSEDIEELGEDIEEMSEDIEEISEDIEEIGEDIEEMKEEDEEAGGETGIAAEADTPKARMPERELLTSIQATLNHLQQEIEKLKASQRNEPI